MVSSFRDSRESTLSLSYLSSERFCVSELTYFLNYLIDIWAIYLQVFSRPFVHGMWGHGVYLTDNLLLKIDWNFELLYVMISYCHYKIVFYLCEYSLICPCCNLYSLLPLRFLKSSYLPICSSVWESYFVIIKSNSWFYPISILNHDWNWACLF